MGLIWELDPSGDVEPPVPAPPLLPLPDCCCCCWFDCDILPGRRRGPCPIPGASSSAATTILRAQRVVVGERAPWSSSAEVCALWMLLTLYC